MIRGNYSLAKEVRKNEQKSKQKIQSRQKHQSKLEQLSDVDPIRIFFQIERLEKISNLDQYQQKKLSKLRQDWIFIKKNKLHEEKVNSFLTNRQKVRDAKQKEERKLRGKDSVYFNPELNPLGKVPDVARTTVNVDHFPNIGKPVKSVFEYERDPVILKYHIKPPEGVPPKFYKHVQNIQKNSMNNFEVGIENDHKEAEPEEYKFASLDTDSNDESQSDG